MRSLPTLLLVFLLGLPGLTLAEGPLRGTAVKTAVTNSGFTLTLATGETILLAGILPPAAVLEQPEQSEAWHNKAADLLDRLTRDKELRLIPSALVRDRHGRQPSQVYLQDASDSWLQGQLIRAGLAVTQAAPSRRGGQRELLTLEDEARRAGAGLWQSPRLHPLSHGQAHKAIGRWRLIEGRVQDTAAIRGRGYINFGADWREDFTIYLNPERLAEFEEASGPLDRLQGRRLRVRGWLVSYNGPMIELSYPEQIEVLE
ncbi:thermonuclease family protein [Fodinicurvata fenggangensis]|uniref:thermonuclease family protein n=1 Tax=Fodinicurvata fenggangensis TaxID=1121830 RepID=UPI00047EB22C|nr:thermonuclease family protein [Fodinicurvata fenggangensis]